MQFEYSAGAFIFLKNSAGGGFRLLLLNKSNGENDIPKGHIEKGETSEQAAKREILEETGIKAELIPYFHVDSKYFFRRSNRTILKKVRFFLVMAHDDTVTISDEHTGYDWLSVKEFEEKIKFKDIVKMLPQVIGYIKKYIKLSEINTEYASLPMSSKEWGLSMTFVPGEGPLDARIMLIGQAPGRFEDVERRPFIGRSGKLLDSVLKSAGMKHKDLYITSSVQFFPPKNRIPSGDEIELCRPFLHRQILAIKPTFVILVGNVSLSAVLEMKSVHMHHGTTVKKDGITYMITLHPAAALRFKASKEIMQKDFYEFGRRIQGSRTRQ